ncbi:unnamed protein product [Caenorhabditis nigoni]
MKRCSQKPKRKSCCQIDVLLSGPGFTNCYASCGYHVVTVYPVHHHASSQDYIDAIDFECYAQIFEEIEATIECATVTGFINCSISGMISSTQLYFNQPQFVENCSITRGKIKNSFIVNEFGAVQDLVSRFDFGFTSFLVSCPPGVSTFEKEDDTSEGCFEMNNIF